MPVRIIAVPLLPFGNSTPLLDAALVMARKLGAHLAVTYADRDAAEDAAIVTAPGMNAAAFNLEEVMAADREEAVRQEVRFDAWCKQHDVARVDLDGFDVMARTDGLVAVWHKERGSVDHVVARAARVADLTVVAKPSFAAVNENGCFEAAVFESGRPAFVLTGLVPADPFHHVLIAWDGSAQASRAVAQSLDVIRAAARVSVFTVQKADQPAPLDLVGALRWHDIDAVQHLVVPDGSGIGAQLVKLAGEQDASLIVMGAYVHSRLQEMLFGGVTAHLLKHATLPLLLTH